MRTRFKANRVCSSDNYRATHKYHFYYVHACHENNKDEVERICNRISSTPALTFDEQVALGKRPYTICFGKKVSFTASDVKKLQGSVSIYWELFLTEMLL